MTLHLKKLCVGMKEKKKRTRSIHKIIEKLDVFYFEVFNFKTMEYSHLQK